MTEEKCTCPEWWFPEYCREEARKLPHDHEGVLAHHFNCAKVKKVPAPIITMQMRMLLEQKCRELFRALCLAPVWCEGDGAECLLAEIGFTLLVYDLGNGPLDHGAFATTLEKTQLVELYEALLKHWEGSEPLTEMTAADLKGRKLMCIELLGELDAFLKSQLPDGQGYSLLVGTQFPICRYIAFGDRAGVSKMIREELLPRWRTEL